ncbi:hypothetical protein Salat_2945500 [Sesamum alatum]|uniref:Uncharacterized protein n=1 Tax=Sesamum alatum TaxID=300844 RepID=A0AAE2C8J5_9LAMI|nr:hypothetical protein Salat_2945500 [Sesamum alatum]
MENYTASGRQCRLTSSAPPSPWDLTATAAAAATATSTALAALYYTPFDERFDRESRSGGAYGRSIYYGSSDDDHAVCKSTKFHYQVKHEEEDEQESGEGEEFGEEGGEEGEEVE